MSEADDENAPKRMLELAKMIRDPTTSDENWNSACLALADAVIYAASRKTIVSSAKLAKRTRAIFERMRGIIETKACGDCGRWVAMILNKNDKGEPITDQMESHFADCPAAEKFRKRGKT